MARKIAIIGGGNLGTAIAEGLLKSKFSKPSDIIITKRNTATLKSFKEKGVEVTDDNAAAVKKKRGYHIGSKTIPGGRGAGWYFKRIKQR